MWAQEGRGLANQHVRTGCGSEVAVTAAATSAQKGGLRHSPRPRLLLALFALLGPLLPAGRLFLLPAAWKWVRHAPPSAAYRLLQGSGTAASKGQAGKRAPQPARTFPGASPRPPPPSLRSPPTAAPPPALAPPCGRQPQLPARCKMPPTGVPLSPRGMHRNMSPTFDHSPSCAGSRPLVKAPSKQT